ncbi:MAG: hypothetical protein IJ371_05025 [Clostridia bacterium]|nr:hypothetical protein [Clostridia bacterium]
MSKYLSIVTLDDGKTVIKINKIPNISQEYTIKFDELNGAGMFFKYLWGETKVSSETFVSHGKNYSTLTIKLEDENNNGFKPTYIAVLENCSWVKSHIESIQNQLVAQVEAHEFDNDIREMVDASKRCVKGFPTLIQSMILQNADKFNIEDLNNIQQTLNDVRSQKMENDGGLDQISMDLKQ